MTYFSVTTMHQRPEDQRDDAEHFVAIERAAVLHDVGDAFLERVERAGADVAIDDADGAEHQRPEAAMANRARVRVAVGVTAGARV